MNRKQLLDAADDLFYKLGGCGNPDARIVTYLIETVNKQAREIVRLKAMNQKLSSSLTTNLGVH